MIYSIILEGDTKVATQGTNDIGSGKNKPKRDYTKPGAANGPKYQKKGEKGGGYGNKSYTPRYSPKDKDDDEEENGRRSRPSRPKDNKSSVSIPDKNKTMLRLEKEQKSIKKKQNKKRESSRPQPKVKRANNVNYTRSYANGDYDDYFDV
ncbi:MAG: hypothetical protein HDT40_12620 [Lachnospiraceae bacterium]|nr:hypothetical protein [Lachnospiraceae bacterium]